MNSKEFKQMFKDEGIFMWEIAKVLKIHEVTFGKWFREDNLSKDREQLVLSAVKEIKLNRLEAQKSCTTQNGIDIDKKIIERK